MDFSNLLQDKARVKKYLIIATIVVLLLIISNLIYNYLSKGSVTILAPNGAEIYEITNVGQYSEKLLSKTKYSGRYNPGTYSFIVKDADKSTIQSVDIERSKNKEVFVELNSIIKPKKMFDTTANNIQANNGYINYINNSYSYLERYTFGNKSPDNYPVSEYNQNISQVIWNGLNRGLINYNLNKYGLLDNSVLTPINITNFGNEGVSNIDINSKNQIIAVVDNSVYIKKSVNGLADEIANNLEGQFNGVSISDNFYMYYSVSAVALGEELSEDSLKNDKSIDRNIHIGSIENPQESFVVKSDSDVSYALFSPDSKKIIFTNKDGINYYDIDDKKTTLIYNKQLPKPNLSLWIDNESFVFIDSDGIWVMDVDNKRANKVGYGDEIRFIKDMTLQTDDKSKLYYTTFIPAEDGSRGEIFLKNLK